MSEQILRTEYSEVMQKSYIDYSMSVICERALPDIRDGLKPVQRRVLYAMNELGLNYDRPHRKSARIVGDTMGKYHPHGDSSIYETLVVLSQDFKRGMALVDGHGNFGSIEGDGAAAMRYTEAKLKKFTQQVYLADLDKNVVDFGPNFDETEREPLVLPVRVPNILINGAEGIAVGMTTNIPPHNLGEVVDAVIAYMDNNEITTKELMKYIKGPDFPSGGIVINKSDLLNIYETGVGKIKLRGRTAFEQGKKRSDKDRLVITEIPYTMIGAGIGKFIADICELIENKKLNDVTDVSNQSSKEGIRIVLELKKNADVEKIKNILYKKTKLEDTFGVNMLAIVDKRPETLGLKSIIAHNVKFQLELASRKYQYLLKKDLEQKEIKEGLIKACNIIDLIIEILRGSTSLKDAKLCLTKGNTEKIKFKNPESKIYASQLNFTEKQAQAILELRLYRLIGLEILALEKEYNELLKRIAEYEDILNNPNSMIRVIKKDLLKIKKEYATDRKTAIENEAAAIYVEEPAAETENMFVMDRFGYAKLIDMAGYERNREAVESENKYVFACMSTDKICVFTDNGSLHQIKAVDIPVKKFRDKGVPLDNLGNYDSSGENIVFLCAAAEIKQKKLLFTTKHAMMKLVDSSEFEVSKRTVASTKLGEGDAIISIEVLSSGFQDSKAEERNDVVLSGGFGEDADIPLEMDTGYIMQEDAGALILEEHSSGLSINGIVTLQTENGYLLRFPVGDVPEKKKSAVGVRGMKLTKEDTVSTVYVTDAGDNPEIEVNNVKVRLRDIKIKKRDQAGQKIK